MFNWEAYLMPCIVIFIILIGVIKKGQVFDWFAEGAADGFKSLLSIAPFLLGMFVAIGVFRASGAMDCLSKIISPIFNLLKIPTELSAFILIRPLSGSGALAVLADIYKEHGADSDIGRMASLMMGSTETIFYTLCVYMGAAGLKRGGYAIPAALLAAFAGVIAAVIAVRLGL